MPLSKTKFFEFAQNNSGGRFHQDPKAGIGHSLIVEAIDHNHANAIAENIGIYFDGCAKDRDCECCGDRWSSCYGEGDEVPSHYGEPLTELGEKNSQGEDRYYYVHFLNGEIMQCVHLKNTQEKIIKQLT